MKSQFTTRLISNRKLDHDELEAAAGNLLGRMIFAYSLFETNVGQSLLNCLSDDHDEIQVDEILNNLKSIKLRLDRLHKIVKEAYPNHEECKLDFAEWKKTAKSVIEMRNNFIHGRWGIHVLSQEVINVVGLPGLKSQCSVRYSLEELEEKVKSVGDVSSKFLKFKKKWPI